MVAPSVSNSFSGTNNQVSVEDPKNAKRLFKLIEEGEWDDAVAQCKKYPDQASKWIVRKDYHHGVSWRRLPIHEACMRQPSEKVMKSLLEAHPNGAQSPDHNGRLALHHACVHNGSLSVIHSLLMAYPESLEHKDTWGKTPLLVAQSTSRKDSPELFAALSKKPYEYHLKKQEQKWVSDEMKRFAAHQMSAQAEKDAYRAKIMSLEEQLKSSEAKIEATNCELDETIARMRKDREANEDSWKAKFEAKETEWKTTLEEKDTIMNSKLEEKESTWKARFEQSENEFRANLSEKELALEALTKEVEAKEDKQKDTEEKWQETERGWKTVKGEMVEKIHHLDSVVESTRAQVHSLDEALSDAISDKEALEHALTSKIEVLKSNLETTKEENNRLVDEAKRLEDTYKEIRALVSFAQTETTNAEMPVTTGQIEALREFMVEKITLEEELTSEVEFLSEGIKASKKARSALEKEVETAKNEIQEMEAKLKEKVESEASLLATVEDLRKSPDFQKEAQTAKNETACLVEILQVTLASESTLKAQIDELRHDLSEAETALKEKEAQVEAREVDLREKQEELEKQKDEMNDVVRKVQEEKEKQKEEMNEVVRQVQEEMDDAVQTLLKEKENAVKQLLHDSKSRLTTLEEECQQEMTKRVQERSKEIESLKEAMSELSNSNSELSVKACHYQNLLSDLETAMNSLTSGLESSIASVVRSGDAIGTEEASTPIIQSIFSGDSLESTASGRSIHHSVETMTSNVDSVFDAMVTRVRTLLSDGEALRKQLFAEQRRNAQLRDEMEELRGHAEMLEERSMAFGEIEHEIGNMELILQKVRVSCSKVSTTSADSPEADGPASSSALP